MTKDELKKIMKSSLEARLDAVERAVDSQFGTLSEVVATSLDSVIFIDELGVLHQAGYVWKSGSANLVNIEELGADLASCVMDDEDEAIAAAEEVIDALLSGDYRAAEEAIDDILDGEDDGHLSLGRVRAESVVMDSRRVIDGVPRLTKDEMQRMAAVMVESGQAPVGIPDDFEHADPVGVLAVLSAIGEQALQVESKHDDGVALTNSLARGCSLLEDAILSGDDDVASEVARMWIPVIPELMVSVFGRKEFSQ